MRLTGFVAVAAVIATLPAFGAPTRHPPKDERTVWLFEEGPVQHALGVRLDLYENADDGDGPRVVRLEQYILDGFAAYVDLTARTRRDRRRGVVAYTARVPRAQRRELDVSLRCRWKSGKLVAFRMVSRRPKEAPPVIVISYRTYRLADVRNTEVVPIPAPQ